MSFCQHDCTASTSVECFACGVPVCTECSARVLYRQFGVQRVAYRCLEEQYKGEPLEAEAQALAAAGAEPWNAAALKKAIRRWDRAALAATSAPPAAMEDE